MPHLILSRRRLTHFHHLNLYYVMTSSIMIDNDVIVKIFYLLGEPMKEIIPLVIKFTPASFPKTVAVEGARPALDT